MRSGDPSASAALALSSTPTMPRGMAARLLKAGIASLSGDVTRVVVILGDQPDITAAIVDQLLEDSGSHPAFRQLRSASTVCCIHRWCSLAQLWADIDALEGDVGCRGTRACSSGAGGSRRGREARGHPLDVDTREDFERTGC